MVWQAATDGSLFQGDDPGHPTVDQRHQILKGSLSSIGWNAAVERHEPQGRFVQFTATIEKVDERHTLEVFIFPNLAYGNRGTRPHEKRIQLTRPYAEHSDDFELGKTSDHKCLLLGFYLGEANDPIICAWDSNTYKNHKDPSSCYVDIRAIAEAYRSGFGRSVDSKNRYVCCFRPDFIHYYLANMDNLHVPENAVEDAVDDAPEEVDSEAQIGAENLIFYGAPGTGKTHTLNEKVGDKSCIRTVFHPDLQNSDFVGALKPVTRNGDVTYEFSPGPFAHALKEALLKPNEEVYLVIEELNRAPAAAVFGDLFLLLDREPDGRSQYDVSFPTDEFKVWLNQCDGITADKLRLPANLWLLATMNSADQGVFPLDTAFRRRWSQEYIQMDYAIAPKGDFEITKRDGSNGPIDWAVFVQVLNDYLTEQLSVAEDRLLGPRFISESELAGSDVATGKILIYLWDDLLRHHGREIIFNRDLVKTYGSLSQRVAEKKLVFSNGFLEALDAALHDGADNA